MVQMHHLIWPPGLTGAIFAFAKFALLGCPAVTHPPLTPRETQADRPDCELVASHDAAGFGAKTDHEPRPGQGAGFGAVMPVY
jgi:hypothetical protein